MWSIWTPNNKEIEFHVSPLWRDILASISWPQPDDFQPFRYIQWREYKGWKSIDGKKDRCAGTLEEYIWRNERDDVPTEELIDQYVRERIRRIRGKALRRVSVQNNLFCFKAQNLNIDNYARWYYGPVFEKLAEHLSVSPEQIRDVVRTELYGILGITFTERRATTREFPSQTHMGLFVPLSMQAAVSRCMDDPAENGVVILKHEISTESLSVLQYIWERDRELRWQYPTMDPTTSPKTVAREVWISLKRAKRYLESLSGVLMPCVLDKSKGMMNRWQMLYRLPTIRHRLTQKLLSNKW